MNLRSLWAALVPVVIEPTSDRLILELAIEGQIARDKADGTVFGVPIGCVAGMVSDSE
jgi:hypothetical protein